MSAVAGQSCLNMKAHKNYNRTGGAGVNMISHHSLEFSSSSSTARSPNLLALLYFLELGSIFNNPYCLFLKLLLESPPTSIVVSPSPESSGLHIFFHCKYRD